MNRGILFALAISLCIFSCQPGQKQYPANLVEVRGEKVPLIRLDQVDDSATTIPLSTFFKEVKIIRFETSPECLISFGKYLITDRAIIVAAMNQMTPVRLLEFSHDGKYIREIGGTGKGPGEHLGYMIDDIRWYPDEDLVLASFLGGPSEQHLFNGKGEFIRSIKVPWFIGRQVYRISDDIYISVGWTSGIPAYQRDSFKIVLHEPNGEWIHSFPRKSYPEKKMKGYTTIGRHSIWRFGEYWRVYNAGDDTIYQIGEHKLTNAAVIDFGDNGIQYNKIVEPRSEEGRFAIEILRETDRFIYILKRQLTKVRTRVWSSGEKSYTENNSFSIVIYDKKQATSQNIRFKDDLLGILPMEHEKMNMRWDEFGNVYRVEHAIDVIEWIENALKANEVPKEALSRVLELRDSLNAQSNPVMFIYKE